MRTYAVKAARNVEPGDVVRFGGDHWMRVATVEEQIEPDRFILRDLAGRRVIHKDADADVHVLDE